MKFLRRWALRGPNLWASHPVYEIEIDLAAQASLRPGHDPALTSRLVALLPGLAASQLTKATNAAETLVILAAEISRQTGHSPRVAIVKAVQPPGVWLLALGCEEVEVAEACCEAAKACFIAALASRPWEAAQSIERLKELAYDVCLGPSTRAIVRAALARGIPIRRLSRGSLVQLGWACRQRRILTAETDRTGAIAEAVAQDKELTRTLLRAVGAPAPEGRSVTDAADAWAAAQDIGPPVVVKPQHGNHGRGVATNLTSQAQVEAAYAAARAEEETIVVERYAPGHDHRVLVIGGRVVAAALREPAQVCGDGLATIAQLVERVNQDPRRSAGHSTVLSKITIDAVARGVLTDQGYTPDSVPPAGEVVLIRRNGNLSTGGTATDVTDHVHPDVAERAVEAARIVGLDIAGVDIVCQDISLPLEEQHGAIVEVNAGPGLRMHLEPSSGQGRPVGEAIVDMLFAPHDDGRVPIVAVTGASGATTTTRLLGHLTRQAGNSVGMSTGEGLFIGRRKLNDDGRSLGAQAVLLNPVVDFAIFETDVATILDEGLGFDHCDVAVVLNVGEENQITSRGLQPPADLARVMRTLVKAVSREGTAVLSAADPLAAAMADESPATMIHFAIQPDLPLIVAHRQQGGRAVFISDGRLTLAQGEHLDPLVRWADLPLADESQRPFDHEHALAAVAAAWAAGLTRDEIVRGLRTLDGR